jgi:hypothetical protein
MKFKVIESNDYTHDYKDKNVFSSWELIKLKRRVGRNPKRITFNPVEAYFQELYKDWTGDVQDKIVFACFASSMATLLVVAILASMLGVS